MNNPTPFDAWINRHLTEMRAPLRQRRTVFGAAGRFRPIEDGEQVIYGPNGVPVRIIERADPEHRRSSGNQIEHGDHLHAVVRPRPAELRLHVK